MKQIIFFLASLFLTAGCSPEMPQTETVKLSVDKTVLEFPGEGGEQTFTVTASEKVLLVPNDAWIKAVKGAVSADYKSVVTVTAEKNPAQEERQTKISVVAGEEKVYVVVGISASGR